MGWGRGEGEGGGEGGFEAGGGRGGEGGESDEKETRGGPGRTIMGGEKVCWQLIS